MANSNNGGNVDINIKTTFNGSGADAATASLNRVAQAEQDVTRQAQNAAQGVTQQAQNAAQGVTQQAQNAAQGVTRQAQNAAQGVTRQAQNAAQGVTQSTGEMAQSLNTLGGMVGIFNSSIGSAFHMMAGLTNGIKGITLALKTLFTHPYTFAIAAIAGAVITLKNAFTKAREEVVELFREGQDDILERIRERNLEVAESFKKISNAVEDATDKMNHLNEVRQMSLSNSRTLEDSADNLEKKRSLEGAVSPDDKLRIEQLYERKALKKEWDRQYDDAQHQMEAEARKVEVLKQERAGLIDKYEGKERDIYDEDLAARRARRMATNERKRFFGGNPELIEKYEKEALEHDQKRNDLIRERKDIENEITKNKREQRQAEERTAELREKFSSVDTLRSNAEKAMAIDHKKQSEELELTKNRAKWAEQEAFRAQDEKIKEENSKLFAAQGRSDAESDWQYRFSKADVAGKRAMLTERHGDALADENSAKAAIVKLTEAIKQETNSVKRDELEKQLSQERGKYSDASGIRRSAEEALRGLEGKDALNSVVGMKLSDRISALGGVSTAGAAAVAGVGFRHKNPDVENIKNGINKVNQNLGEINKSVKNSNSRWSA